jgi:hypothetical protein
MKLFSSFKQVLTEAVSFDDLQRAIKNLDVIVITYDGDEPGGKGYRTVYPVCLGRSLKGNMVLRAYEPEGVSHSVAVGKKVLPGWRLFRVDKTFTFQRTGEKFSTLPNDYNANGDKLMTQVYINAKLPTPGQEIELTT